MLLPTRTGAPLPESQIFNTRAHARSHAPTLQGLLPSRLAFCGKRYAAWTVGAAFAGDMLICAEWGARPWPLQQTASSIFKATARRARRHNNHQHEAPATIAAPSRGKDGPVGPIAAHGLQSGRQPWRPPARNKAPVITTRTLCHAREEPFRTLPTPVAPIMTTLSLLAASKASA